MNFQDWWSSLDRFLIPEEVTWRHTSTYRDSLIQYNCIFLLIVASKIIYHKSVCAIAMIYLAHYLDLNGSCVDMN